MDVPSNPRSAKSLRPMSSSCSRRSLPVIRLRWLLLESGRFTSPSWRSRGHQVISLRRAALRHRAKPLAPLAGELSRQPPLIRPAHIPGPAELLRPPDRAGADIDLPFQRAVAGARRVGVVQVVPGLAE